MPVATPTAAAPTAPTAPATPASAPAAKPSIAPPPDATAPEGRQSKAWESVRADLRKAAGEAPQPETAKPSTPTAEKPTTPAAPAATKPEASENTKKPSPWRLVDQLKQERVRLEQKVLELEKRALPEDQWKATQERLTAAEQRAKEYEDHIRYTNYQQSEEFKTKFQQPYEKAWKSAMGELREITVTDAETGQVRTFSSSDMVRLCNMTLPEASKLARETYGDLAPEVMAHRKSILELDEAQTEALEDARKNGAAREAKRQEEFKSSRGKIEKEVKEAYDKAQQDILNHPDHGKWLKPIEGDDEHNSALEKSKAFALASFRANPLTPGLTPEQRVDAVRRHAAVINRAAAYPILNREIKKLSAERDTLKKELEQFRASVPGNGQPAAPSTEAPTGGSAWERMRAELRKVAH